MKSNIFSSCKLFISPLLLLGFTLFVFGPVELFITNKNEFWFDIIDVLPILILIFVLFFLIFFIISTCLPQNILKYVLPAVYALSFLIYLQGNYFPNDYGVLDGNQIEWSNYLARGIINSLLWIGVFVIIYVSCYKFRNKTINALVFISYVIVAAEMVTLLVLIVTNDKSADTNRYLSKEGQFEISSTENTIVFLLDCFDSEVFTQLLDESRTEIEETFEDFTFFHNMVGGATRTKYAIPYIFTGQTNTRVQSYPDYIRQSYEESAFVKEIEAGEYDVRLYTNPVYVDTKRDDFIDNVADDAEIGNKYGLVFDIFRLTAFRYSPHVLKRYFWFYSGSFEKYKKTGNDGSYATNDPLFYKELFEQGLTINSDKSSFRFFHLNGAHGPYTMNENCENVDAKYSSESRQALGSLRIVGEYINQLKKLNKYDDSTIIVMSDHGGRFIEQNPMFMIKEKNNSDSFSVSEIPLSYKNLNNLFADAVSGKIMDFENVYRTDGERLFYVEHEKNGLINIVEYSIVNRAYDIDSIAETGKVFHADSLEVDYKYKLGTVLSFAEDETANKYCIEGFSKNEGDFTWSEGYRSALKLELDNYKKGNLEGIVNYNTVFGGHQNVNIFVNDYFLGHIKISGNGEFRFIISEECIKGYDTLNIEFEYPKANSPKNISYDKKGDSRLLAVAFRSIKLVNTDAINSNYTLRSMDNAGGISFNFNDGGADRFISGGFSHEEEWGTWTDGNKASMRFFDIEPTSDVKLTYSYITYHEQNVTVYANGKQVDAYISEGSGERTIIIQKDLIDEYGIEISFDLPDANSPLNLGESQDGRMLAIGFKTMSLSKSE